MANRAKWPQLGVQPQNLNEHATQLIAEASALLALDKGQRPKLPDQLFESFISSVQTYARKTREQPSSHEILDKLDQIHSLTKTPPPKTSPSSKMQSTIPRRSLPPESPSGRRGSELGPPHLTRPLHQPSRPPQQLAKTERSLSN